MAHLSANGFRIHYDTAGDGPALLLLHGLGSSTADWEVQVPTFSAYYHVVTMDLRGHGQSDKPRGPYAMCDFASDTVALLQSLGITQSHVMGLSLGGMVALALALDWPDHVASLVLVNALPRAPFLDPRLLRNTFRRSVTFATGGMDALGRAVAHSLFPKPYQRILREEGARRLAQNDLVGYGAAIRAVFGFNGESRLTQIRCPTLVVAGDRDKTAAWRQKVRLAQRIAAARLVVIPDSGHATPQDQPARFNPIVLEFLESVEKARTSQTATG